MKLIRSCAVVAVLAGLLFWAAPVGADDNAAAAAAQKLLDLRAASIIHNDKAVFLKTIDPNATAAFKTAQGNFFDGLESLPLTKFSLAIRTADSGDLAAGLSLASKHNATQSYLPETRETYRLGTYDNVDAVDSYWYTYVERNGSWYIAADDDAQLIGLTSAQELWDNGALSVQPTQHFLVLTTKVNGARGTDLGAIAEQALSVFNTRWKLPWSQKVPLIDPGSAQEAARLLQTSANVADFAAFVSYVPLRDTGWQVTAPRIYAQDANLSQEPAAEQTDTLVHELTHVATAGLSGPFTPTWVQEGIAEWIRLDLPSAVNPVIAGPALPSSTDFTSQSGAQVGQAYKSATSAMALIDSIAGPNGPPTFFQALGARRLNIGSPSYNIDQALKQVTGMTTAQFVAVWDAKYPSVTQPDATSTPAA